jgi:hypothetical protein
MNEKIDPFDALLRVLLAACLGILLIMALIMAPIVIWYMPAALRADIEAKRALAKALSGCDLRDEETRQVIRELIRINEKKQTP